VLGLWFCAVLNDTEAVTLHCPVATAADQLSDWPLQHLTGLVLAGFSFKSAVVIGWRDGDTSFAVVLLTVGSRMQGFLSGHICKVCSNV